MIFRKKWMVVIAKAAIFISMEYGCNYVNQKHKPIDFYEIRSEADLSLIPLLQPYKLASADRGFTWFFEFPVETVLTLRGGVDSVAVHDSLIYLRYPMMYWPKHSMMHDTWVIFDVNDGEVRSFFSLEEMMAEVKSTDVKFYNCCTLYHELKLGAPLPFSAAANTH
ncbi:MAG: hypothetical protein ACKVOR_01780 [Flavobacteriales bacterium]